MDDKKIKFRTAMGGYKKEDVNGYIEQLSSEYYESETKLKKKIEELEKRVRVLTEKVEDLEIKTMELEDGAEESEKSRELLAKDNEEKTAIIEGLNGTIEGLKADNEALREEQTRLLAEMDEAKSKAVDSEVYEKSSKYDQVSGQIGSMIVTANARAESIVSEAELKARISANAMIDTTVQKLNAINEKYSSEIMTKTVQLTEELRSLSLAAESFRAGTKSAVEKECRELKESLECTKRVILEDNK